MNRFLRDAITAALLAAISSCGSGDPSVADIGAPEQDDALPSIPLPEPGPPADAEVVPIPATGGTLELAEGIRIVVPPDAVEGALELASWQPPAVEGLLEPWQDRVRPLGEPFSFSVVGRGLLAAGRLEAAIDETALEDGWEVGLLQYAPGLLAQAGDSSSAVDEARRLPWSLACAGHEIGQDVTADVLGLMPQLRRERYFQLVALPEGTTRKLGGLADLGVEACVHMIDPPVHDGDAYTARVEAALRASIESAREMGFNVPTARNGPLSINVIGGYIMYGRPGVDRRYTGAATVNGAIVLRNDLHTWLPRSAPAGALERAVAHELFHVIQGHSMTEATLNAVTPGHGNLWAIEGGATWFAREVFPEASRGLPRPDGSSLRANPDQAWAFWAFLEEKLGYERGIMREVLTMSEGHALGTAGVAAIDGRRREGALVPAYEWLDLAEALNAVLGRRNLVDLLGPVQNGDFVPFERDGPEPLSIAYANYAKSLFFDADFDIDDIGDALNPGLWYGQPPGNLRPGALTRLDLTGGSRTDPIELQGSSLIGSELSARIVSLSSPTNIGRSYRFSEVRYPEASDIHVAIADLTTGWQALRFHVPEDLPTWNFTYWEDGPTPPTSVLVANTGWNRWRPAEDPAGSRVSAARAGEPLSFELAAEPDLYNWQPKQPIGPKVGVQSSGKTYCVSRQGDEDCQGTINQALQNPELEPGDTIEVRPGLYAESLEIGIPVNIVATQPGRVVVRAAGTVVDVKAPDVGIANFVIVSDGGSSTDFAVRIREVTDTYLANNVIIRENGGGIVAVRSPGTTLTDNWVATPRWGIRVWGSAGATVVSNVVSPAWVRSDIQDFALTESDVEWPGEKPWTLTEAAIDIAGSNGIVLTDNHVGPGTSSTDGYESAISITGTSGADVSRNTAFAYNAGIFMHRSSTATVADNRAAGLRGLDISESDTITLTRNHGRGRWIGLDVAASENVRLVGNEWAGGGPNEFAVLIDDSDEISVLSDTVFGRRDGRGGMWVRGGTGLAVTDASVSGWSVGLEVDGTSGVNLSTSTFEQRRHDDHPAWASAALALVDVTAPGAEDLSLKAGARAMLLEDVHFFRPERLTIELASDGLDIITARNSEMRAADAWIHSEADGMFVAENARLSFDGLALGVPELPPIAAFNSLEFADGGGGPQTAGTNATVSEEKSILSQEWDLSTIWSSSAETLWLPFVWYVENGDLELSASLNVERTPPAVSSDVERLEWRTAPILAAFGADSDPSPGTDLDVSYSGVVPLRIHLALPRAADTEVGSL